MLERLRIVFLVSQLSYHFHLAEPISGKSSSHKYHTTFYFCNMSASLLEYNMWYYVTTTIVIHTVGHNGFVFVSLYLYTENLNSTLHLSL